MIEKELLDYFNGDELAADVWLNKYAQIGDKTPDDMHRRMAKEFARIEKNYQNGFEKLKPNDSQLSKYGQNRDHLTEESIYQLFKDFKYIVPQGSIMSQLGSRSIGSLSNCFVIGQPQDSYGGIFQKDEEMAQLMKRRGGVGLDISTLRPQGTATSNAAKSSTGAISFMHRFSNTTREVAQNGRRGALMLSIDINHPDVMEFIKIKRDLTQVTGANISIKLNKEFMEAVEKDEDYILRFPCDLDLIPYYEHLDTKELQDSVEYNTLFPYILNNETKGYTKKIRAKEYWDEIIKSAHNVAEPGLMFWDNMIDYSPDGVYPQYRAITTNPCSEIGMQEYDACRLMCVNLFSFVVNPFTPTAYFDHDQFYKVNYEAMRLSDDLIDLELEHIERIIIKIKDDPEPSYVKYKEISLWNKIRDTASNSRRTGLGFTGLADAIAAMGYAYDSEIASVFVEDMMSVKMESELDCSIDMAIMRGTFEGWNRESEFLGSESKSGLALDGHNEFYDFLCREFPDIVRRMYEYGRRNVSWSTVAPTGTVSIMTQTSSGIEPVFQPFYIRRKKINPNDEGARVDFIDQNGDTWQEFPVLHPKFKEWINFTYGAEIITAEGGMGKEELQHWFEKSPWYKSTANDIDWTKRVELQAIIQRYISHSISSTINLPSNVTEEEVSKIYMQSWKKGLKGITVYRDGSRSGVLVTEPSKITTDKFGYNEAPVRPKTLEADYYFATSKGKKYAILVGLLDGNPYEVFAFEDPIEEKSLKGTITKEKKGSYKFTSNSYTIENLQLSSEHTDERLLTRWMSLLLRHGANPKFVIEQTEKSEVGITNFVKVLVRILKKYIPDGEKSTVSCKECGSDNVVFEEGCMSCKSCGSSKCG